MSAPHSSRFQTLSDGLLPASEVKVWSVIVTILGDLVPLDGQGLDGPILTALIEKMGIQPQAMRVALHRLKKDGWIESDRNGRIGIYRLSAMARERTLAVTGRVYGQNTPRAEELFLVTLGPDMSAPEPAFEIAPRSFLSLVAVEGAISSPLSQALPDWLTVMIDAAAMPNDFGALLTCASAMAKGAMPTDVIERAALRLMLLHRWRRLVLRSDPVVEALLPDAATVHVCRGAVMGVLAQLPRPDIAALADAVGLSG